MRGWDRSVRAHACWMAVALWSGCDDDRRLIPLVDAGMDASTRDANVEAGDGDGGSMDASVSPSDRLQGLWEGLCVPDEAEDGGIPESTRQGFAFRGNQLVSRIERYFDASCGTAVVRLELSGTFVVGDAVDEGGDIRALDITITGITAQLLDADFEDVANAERFLGFDDWDADVARDVLGVDVFGTGTPLRANDTIYQVFQVERVRIDGVEVPVLSLGVEGANGPVLDPTLRPTMLSPAPHVYAGPAN